MNKVIMIGRLTHEPELKITDSELKICRYRLAVQKEYKPKEADFFNCVAFKQGADFVSRWFHKGDMIAVIGHLSNSIYETASGEKRISTEIIVDKQYFCGNRAQNAEAHFEPINEADDEDMPF